MKQKQLWWEIEMECNKQSTKFLLEQIEAREERINKVCNGCKEESNWWLYGVGIVFALLFIKSIAICF